MRNCTGRVKAKSMKQRHGYKLQMTDFTSYIESDFTQNYVASQKINVKKKKESLSVAIFFFFATSICTQDMHFHPIARK